jgi:hypothetical protein
MEQSKKDFKRFKLAENFFFLVNVLREMELKSFCHFYWSGGKLLVDDLADGPRTT